MSNPIQEKLRKKLATLSRSTTQPDSDVPVVDASAIEAAQKALIDEIEKEERQRGKKSEKNKKRKQALKRKGKAEDNEAIQVESSSEEEENKTVTPTVIPAPVLTPVSTLADDLEQAEISVVIERDAVTQLQLEISEVLAELQAGRQELEILQAQRATAASSLAAIKREREIAESEIRDAQQSGEAAVRKVEELRRELDKAEHRRFRARQEFEKKMATALAQIQSEQDLVELKISKTVSERTRLASEERGGAAAEGLKKEREKLHGVLRMIGVPEEMLPVALKEGQAVSNAGALLPALSPDDVAKLLAAREDEEKKKRAELSDGSSESLKALDTEIEALKVKVPLFLMSGCSDSSDLKLVEQARAVLQQAAAKQ